mmetsp:Transcript_24107/g.45784  ORF Transcript_24107/g.45784 Transcript_24107/m.45784 type:complete len:407 (-) Transcript_24107:347-1567(-)
MGGLISRPSVNGEARLRELQHHIALGYVGAKYNEEYDSTTTCPAPPIEELTVKASLHNASGFDGLKPDSPIGKQLQHEILPKVVPSSNVLQDLRHCADGEGGAAPGGVPDHIQRYNAERDAAQRRRHLEALREHAYTRGHHAVHLCEDNETGPWRKLYTTLPCSEEVQAFRVERAGVMDMYTRQVKSVEPFWAQASVVPHVPVPPLRPRPEDFDQEELLRPAAERQLVPAADPESLPAAAEDAIERADADEVGTSHVGPSSQPAPEHGGPAEVVGRAEMAANEFADDAHGEQDTECARDNSGSNQLVTITEDRAHTSEPELALQLVHETRSAPEQDRELEFLCGSVLRRVMVDEHGKEVEVEATTAVRAWRTDFERERKHKQALAARMPLRPQVTVSRHRVPRTGS